MSRTCADRRVARWSTEVQHVNGEFTMPPKFTSQQVATYIVHLGGPPVRPRQSLSSQ